MFNPLWGKKDLPGQNAPTDEAGTALFWSFYEDPLPRRLPVKISSYRRYRSPDKDCHAFPLPQMLFYATKVICRMPVAYKVLASCSNEPRYLKEYKTTHYVP
jgi:hypothetical protein